METILGYDSTNLISLNWVALSGIILGSVFTYYVFALRKWKYKTMTVIAFSAITGYLMYFYFRIDYDLPKEALALPIFLRSFGYVIIAICFLTALSRVPFQHFFEAVSVQAFVSAGFGSVLGTAILGRALNVVMKKNAILLSANLDHVNPVIGYILKVRFTGHCSSKLNGYHERVIWMAYDYRAFLPFTFYDKRERYPSEIRMASPLQGDPSLHQT